MTSPTHMHIHMHMDMYKITIPEGLHVLPTVQPRLPNGVILTSPGEALTVEKILSKLDGMQ